MSTELVNGNIPAGKKCPYEFIECKLGKSCNLYSHGTKDGIAGPKGFSCAAARAIVIINKHEDKMSELRHKALELAKRIHSGQVDKAGIPYIQHPIAVSSMVETDEEVIVALLHDTVEDTDTDPPAVVLAEIYKTFGERIGDAVAAITHVEGESYQSYIMRLRDNQLAKTVKIADIDHNNSPIRLAHLPVRLQYGMVCKHIRARHYLLTGEWFKDDLVDQLIKYRYKE